MRLLSPLTRTAIQRTFVAVPRTFWKLCPLLFSLTFAFTYGRAETAEFTQNTGGGNAVTIQILLGSYPGRGQNFPINLSYSSRGLWRIGFIRAIPLGSSVWQSVTEAIYAEHSTAGWTTSLDVPKVEWPKLNDVYWYTGKPYPRGTVNNFTYRVAQLFLHMPGGSTHEMRRTDAVYRDGGFISMTGTFYAVDGSRMRYDSTGENTGTLYLPNGARYILAANSAQFIDRNGNTLNYDANSRQWTDTLGRVIGMPWPVNPSPGEYTYSLPGINGSTIEYKLTFNSLSNVLTPDAQGQLPPMKPAGDYYLPDPNSPPTGAGTANFPQATQVGSHFVSAYNNPVDETPSSFNYVIGRGQSGANVFNPTVLAKISLPNGQSYKFTYNGKGELDKVVYPTGGYQRYQYAQVPTIGGSSIPYHQGTRGIISRWVSANGTGSDEAQWQYSITGPGYVVKVTAPDNSRTETVLFHKLIVPNSADSMNFGYRDARNGSVIEERVYAPGGAMLRRSLTELTQSIATFNKPVPPNTNNTGTYTANRNPRAVRVVNLILDTGGWALAKTTTFEYAQNGFEFSTGLDVTTSTEHHFQTIDPTIAQTDPITSMTAGTPATKAVTTYLKTSAYQGRNLLGLRTSVVLWFVDKDGGWRIASQTESAYDEAVYPLLIYGDLSGPGYVDPGTNVRGNVTTTRQYVDPGTGIYVETHTQFDQCGNVRIASNERGIQSHTEYSSTYKHAFATQTTSEAPDSSGAYGSAAPFTTSTTFDYNTGLALATTNINGQTSTFSYQDELGVNDPLNRLRKVINPDGSWTKYSFGDELGNLFTLTETSLDANRSVKSFTFFDPLGRPSRAFSSEKASSYLATDTIYDQMGRVWKVSNRYRTSTVNGVADLSNTSDWTVSHYDALGRIDSVTLPDSSVVQTTYQGIHTTVTDQAGRQRREKTNALGQIVRVDEPNLSGSLGDVDNPTQASHYEYNGLGNLVHITQGSGAQTQHRYFKYDALGRLTHERHVEQAVKFTAVDPLTGNSAWSRMLVYDETIEGVKYSGLLTSAYDARNIQTQFRYDNLNRIYQVNYSDGTPTVTNIYDQNHPDHFNNGQLTEARTAAVGSVPATAQTYNFDRMGRAATHQQTVGGQTYDMSYSYNLGGALTSQKYPSGRVVSYGFDDGARLSDVSSGVTLYATKINYSSPTGQMKSMFIGNGTLESYTYNSRLQLISLDLSKSGTQIQHYDYTYGVYDPATNTVDEARNNGQIAQIESFIGTQKQWKQRFAYDNLNRLTSGREFAGEDNTQPSYVVNYEYDLFGNRYQRQAQNGGNPFTQKWVEPGQIDQASNRFNSGVTYDDAGNITVDSRFRNLQFQYDANNRQRQSANLDNSGIVVSVFDAGGQRVANQVGGSLTNVLVYDVGGKLVAEYGLTTVNGGTQYIFSDAQGSPRAITNTQGAVISRHDYLPFGEELGTVGMRTSGQGYGGIDAARQKYAGMENNEATGMSHTLWRQYDSFSGRWTSPDPYGGSVSITSPQSFNRYTYVNNDPINHVDPLGLMLSDIGVYQTDNAGEARLLEIQSHRDFVIATNALYKIISDRLAERGVGRQGVGLFDFGGCFFQGQGKKKERTKTPEPTVVVDVGGDPFKKAKKTNPDDTVGVDVGGGPFKKASVGVDVGNEGELFSRNANSFDNCFSREMKPTMDKLSRLMTKDLIITMGAYGVTMVVSGGNGIAASGAVASAEIKWLVDVQEFGANELRPAQSKAGEACIHENARRIFRKNPAKPN